MQERRIEPQEPIPGPYSIVWGCNGTIHGESIFNSEKEAEEFYEEQAKRWFDGYECEGIYCIMVKEGRFIEFNGGCVWELEEDGYYTVTDCDYGYSMDVSDYRDFNRED